MCYTYSNTLIFEVFDDNLAVTDEKWQVCFGQFCLSWCLFSFSLPVPARHLWFKICYFHFVLKATVFYYVMRCVNQINRRGRSDSENKHRWIIRQDIWFEEHASFSSQLVRGLKLAGNSSNSNVNSPTLVSSTIRTPCLQLYRKYTLRGSLLATTRQQKAIAL